MLIKTDFSRCISAGRRMWYQSSLYLFLSPFTTPFCPCPIFTHYQTHFIVYLLTSYLLSPCPTFPCYIYSPQLMRRVQGKTLSNYSIYTVFALTDLLIYFPLHMLCVYICVMCLLALCFYHQIIILSVSHNIGKIINVIGVVIGQ